MATFGNVTGKEIPANPRLWELLVARAKHQFTVYPSPAASHWVHQKYEESGGQFVKSKKDLKERERRLKKTKKKEDSSG